MTTAAIRCTSYGKKSFDLAGLPPLEESAIEDLTDAEWQAFWDAITNV